MKTLVLGSGILLLCLALEGCGNGTGFGLEEIQKQERKLWTQLSLDWDQYNQGDYQGSVDAFTQTRDQADLLEDESGIRKAIQSEALNGIGWSFFRLQDLDQAWISFQQATRLNRQNADAWVGWSGVALAMKRYIDAVQFAKQALEASSIQALDTQQEYNSAFRPGGEGLNLGHDRFDLRHVRLVLAEAYFHQQRYSAGDRPDPNNAAAQLRLIGKAGSLDLQDFKYVDPGNLLQEISRAAFELRRESARGL